MADSLGDPRASESKSVSVGVCECQSPVHPSHRYSLSYPWVPVLVGTRTHVTDVRVGEVGRSGMSWTAELRGG